MKAEVKRWLSRARKASYLLPKTDLIRAFSRHAPVLRANQLRQFGRVGRDGEWRRPARQSSPCRILHYAEINDSVSVGPVLPGDLVEKLKFIGRERRDTLRRNLVENSVDPVIQGGVLFHWA